MMDPVCFRTNFCSAAALIRPQKPSTSRPGSRWPTPIPFVQTPAANAEHNRHPPRKVRRLRTDDIQDAVDELAETLRRAVVICDPVVRLICASRHFGDADGQRVKAMLQRESGPEAARHVLEQDVGHWSRTGIIPAKPEIGMSARLCAPIRAGRHVLGYVLVIDAHGDLTPNDIELITALATRIATPLAADDSSAGNADRAREEATVLALSDDAQQRETGIRILGASAGPAHVNVVGISIPDDHDLRMKETVVHHIRAWRRNTGQSAEIGFENNLAYLVRTWPFVPSDNQVRAPIVDLVGILTSIAAPNDSVIAGIGELVANAHDAWKSRKTADIALCAARTHAHRRPVADWATLGADALLVQLTQRTESGYLEPASIRALRSADTSGTLTKTLRAFLDHGGSVPRAAAALHLHRTSLYYRLDRIRELTGLDLDDGENRLLLHLSLRLTLNANNSDINHPDTNPIGEDASTEV